MSIVFVDESDDNRRPKVRCRVSAFLATRHAAFAEEAIGLDTRLEDPRREMKSQSMISEFVSLASILMISFGSISCWAQDAVKEVKPAESNQTNAIQDQFGLDPEKPLIQRVGETPDSVLAIFREAGMSPKPYSLTDDDRQKLIAAIAILPPLHQAVLKQRLRRISLLDDMPNTALTSEIDSTEPYPLFDVTIRAAILKQTAAEWLKEKESSCFQGKDSKYSLRVDIGNITAIQYVLLHEATHIVDATRTITPSTSSSPEAALRASATPFTLGIWEDARTPVSRYLNRELMEIRFRRGGRVTDASNMKSLYEALGRTPFVSLYGSSARTEDLAEYLTVYHLTQKLHQPFKISVYEGDREVLVHDPMKSEITRSRFELMSQFYEASNDERSPGK